MGIPGPASVSTKQQRIADMARQAPEMAFTSLFHHIDRDWLHEAYRRTRKDGAAGIDGQTAKDYAANLEENLGSLLDRAKSGDRYKAPPVRRVYIPKGDGGTRPLGIPPFEDKVLQRAVVMVLEPICEQDFLDCSYGFRPGRSAHQALRAGWKQLMARGGGWVLEVDIRKFFDILDHRYLREILERRVRDGVTFPSSCCQRTLAALLTNCRILSHLKTTSKAGWSDAYKMGTSDAYPASQGGWKAQEGQAVGLCAGRDRPAACGL